MTGIARPGVERGVQGGRESQRSVWGGATEGASGGEGEGGLGRPHGQSYDLGLLLLAQDGSKLQGVL